MDIVIERNGFRLVLLPGLGGSVGSFSRHGLDILRGLDASAAPSPLEAAGFPLFPFSGRIDQGHFQWNSRDVQLDPNFPPESHAIHGQAWLAAWQVEAITSHSARLSYHHEADSWPWSYLAVQDFRLKEDGLTLELSLHNLSDEDMPAGLGWHPYFPRRDARLSANVSGIWTATAGMIPDTLRPLGPANDLTAPRDVTALALDNAFAARPANADIIWPSAGLHVALRSSPELNHLVVFVPAGEKFFCVEPVSHAPDAINARMPADVTGLRKLAPRDVLRATIDLTVIDLK